jgi:D-alanyl-D-alanine carboxypeptidase (penicillin-binding protein 5/6)
VPEFVKLMNQRAKEIGCTNTHFDNPNGLNDELHTISARDLALIAREAMKYPQFREVVAQRRHTLVRSINTQDRFLISHNKYLAMDTTADGIKTGWTVPAGQCYVGSATRNGYRLITVLLKSDNWKTDHAAMLDWGFANCGHKVVVAAGSEVATIPIKEGTKNFVTGTVDEDVLQAYLNENASPVHLDIQQSRNIVAPVYKGQQIGTLCVTDEDGWQERLPIVATTTVPKAQALLGAGNVGFLFTIGALGWSAFLLKRRKRRSAKYAKALRRKTA